MCRGHRSIEYGSRAGEFSCAATVARPRPPLVLDEAERESMLAVVASERFADLTRPATYLTLRARGQYRPSVRTMYQLLAAGQNLE